MLVGDTSVVEPGCPALSEAAAIVEAEWIRLRRPSEPARHPTCELPSARRCRRRTGTIVCTEPTGAVPSARVRGHEPRWAVSPVWARERSPPQRA
ncbi:hypothetical protein [Mycobacterium paraffinicum]|uniref:hypothetical protein n=1 Tax=Mycobacterium paraffinicum TaxID=53378 RepID=UPI001114F7DD|nr:hypothetical protein [Mycobacterium paraffinicum]